MTRGRFALAHGALSVLHNRPGPAVRLGLREVVFGSCVLMCLWASARQMCCSRGSCTALLEPTGALGLGGMALYI